MINHAKKYFDTTKKYSDIQCFVSTRTREGNYLDFKKIHDQANPDKEIKKALAEAASGFAHQKGGIIVWGIEAKQTKSGDCAQSEQPISKLSEVFEKIKKFSTDCVEPRLNIEHELIYLNDDLTLDTGFIVSFFPKSNDIHCAKGTPFNFYQRHGDMFIPMITGDELKMLLNRNAEPKLELVVTSSVRSYTTDRDGKKNINGFSYRLFLKNKGNMLAEYPSLEIKASVSFSNIYDSSGNSHFVIGSFVSTNDQRSRLFVSNAGIAVHPNQELCIGSANFDGSVPPKIEYKCYA